MPRDGSSYVSPHAVARAIDRLRTRHPKPHGYPELDTTVRVEEWIREEVKAAVAARRVDRVKPRWARLYGERGEPLPRGQRFVWHREESIGWVVADLDLASGSGRVVTTLVRVTARGAALDQPTRRRAR